MLFVCCEVRDEASEEIELRIENGELIVPSGLMGLGAVLSNDILSGSGQCRIA